MLNINSSNESWVCSRVLAQRRGVRWGGCSYFKIWLWIHPIRVRLPRRRLCCHIQMRHYGENLSLQLSSLHSQRTEKAGAFSHIDTTFAHHLPYFILCTQNAIEVERLHTVEEIQNALQMHMCKWSEQEASKISTSAGSSPEQTTLKGTAAKFKSV